MNGSDSTANMRRHRGPWAAVLGVLGLASSWVRGENLQLETIVATDPDIRAGCQQFIQHRLSPWAQYEQDTFIWHNYLRQLGNNGTYVDVGAYDPLFLSNTAFLDLCLGWTGICVEMNDERRPLFEQSPRTCKFVNTCVSGSYFHAKMRNSRNTQDPFSASVQSVSDDYPALPSDPTVTCRPLASVLAEHDMWSVDFLSLDIEGQEVEALSGMNTHALLWLGTRTAMLGGARAARTTLRMRTSNLVRCVRAKGRLACC